MTRNRRPSYFSGDTARGLDILRLQIGVETRALRMGALMVLFGCLSAGGLWFFYNVSLLELGDLGAHMAAWVSVHWIGNTEQLIPVQTDTGWQQFTARGILRTPYIADSVANATRQALIAAGIGAVLLIPLTILVIRLARARGRNVYSDRVARGTPIVPPATLKRAVRRAGASSIEICGVPLPEQALNRHILLLGSTRSGKSLSIRRMLREIERRGDMAIVFDKVGDYVSEFYKPDRQDLLMNPLDRRSAPWSPWCEGDTPVDHMRIARSLIPRRPGDKNVFFQEGARTLLVALLERVGAMEGRSLETLLDVAYRWDRGRKAALLEGTDAAKHFIGDSDAGHDVDATMGVFAQGLRYLPRSSGMGEDRSIRRFIRDVVRLKEEGAQALLAEIESVDPETGEIFAGTALHLADPIGRRRRDEILRLQRVIEAGRTPWMFLAAETEKMDALMPLLGCWIDLAVTSVLGLRPREARRIWIVLDEWHTLGKLSRLQDVLTEGAKYGASVVAGTQNVGQIRENYGSDSAEAMLSLFNTKAVFRLPEPVSAEWASRYMGDLVWDQARESVRYGTSETMDGASIADGRVVERKVMAHEIIDLPDLTAYLSISGDFPVAKVTTAFDAKRDPARESVAPFVARPFEDLAWGAAAPVRPPARHTDAAGRAGAGDGVAPSRGDGADGPRFRPFVPPGTTGRQSDDDPGRHPFDPRAPGSQDPGPAGPAGVDRATGPGQSTGEPGGPAPHPGAGRAARPDRLAKSEPGEGAGAGSGSTHPPDRREPGTSPEGEGDDAQEAPDDRQPDLFDAVPLEDRIDALDRKGLSQRQIAEQLNVSRSRVQRHLSGHKEDE